MESSFFLLPITMIDPFVHLDFCPFFWLELVSRKRNVSIHHNRCLSLRRWRHNWDVKRLFPRSNRIQGWIQDLIRGGPQIVTGLKRPFWGLSFVEFWCWGLIFGGQGGPGPRAPLDPPLHICISWTNCLATNENDLNHLFQSVVDLSLVKHRYIFSAAWRRTSYV